MKLRHKLSNVIRNLVYLSQLDYKQALANRLSDGRRIEHNAPNDLRHCPICGTELERTVQQGFIIPFCPKWHIHPTKPAPFPDVERFTDKVQRPGQFGSAVHRELQQKGVGVDTAISRALPKRPYPTVKLSPDRERR